MAANNSTPNTTSNVVVSTCGNLISIASTVICTTPASSTLWPNILGLSLPTVNCDIPGINLPEVNYNRPGLTDISIPSESSSTMLTSTPLASEELDLISQLASREWSLKDVIKEIELDNMKRLARTILTSTPLAKAKGKNQVVEETHDQGSDDSDDSEDDMDEMDEELDLISQLDSREWSLKAVIKAIELDNMERLARAGQVVVKGGKGGKSVKAQERLARGRQLGGMRRAMQLAGTSGYEDMGRKGGKAPKKKRRRK